MQRGKELLRTAVERGIPYATFWGMSVDNLLKRSRAEVTALVTIFHHMFEDFWDDKDLHEKRIRIRVLGKWAEKFPAGAVKAIERVQEATKDYNDFHMTLLLAYNGTDEIIEAIQAITREAEQREVIVDSQTIKNHLLTKELPPVDLVIRTGGEPHLSNGFMMWDTTDSELYFSQKFWPEFESKDFDEALAWYGSRERRLGK
jgi:undecaprenyl diphosphate synthase